FFQGKNQATKDRICYCKTCMKIRSGNHPDIIHVKPSGAYIKIAQIRSLRDILAMKPYEARIRVVIISDAQAMNPSAGNALLKVLEEPPARTLLILTSIQSSDLLPTIVSRCQHIRFNPISCKSLKDILVDKDGLDYDDAKIIATLASGSLSKAFSMIETKNRVSWINRRSWLINTLNFNMSGKMSTQPVVSLLAFAAELSKNKEILQDSLDVIKSWLRDLIVYKYCPEKIINKDLIDNIQYISEKITARELIAKNEAIQTAQKRIKIGANLRLTLETMVVQLAYEPQNQANI
ncbi:MAG: DNA polymerase III subunit delta' C-terminal domain-containing protein, partial [Thermodesulfobacteriota bacterium]|nr:DNA polymerase III subunit delta' C-terminal domain-containing protein [Thermodesulfobacteriota bacterium]